MQSRTKNIVFYTSAAIAFLFIGIVQHREILTGTMIWDERFSEYIPWRVEMGRLLRGGEFPFFTERLYAGMPLFSAAYNGVLYPFNWLYVFFDHRIANWLAVLHTLIGGMGMMVYLRSHRISRFSTFIASLFFVTGTFGLIHEPHVSMREAAMLAPFVVWAAKRLLDQSDHRRVVTLALLLALQIAIGYWQINLFTIGWIAVEWLAQFKRDRLFVFRTGGLTLAVLLGAGLMAVLLVTTIEHVEQTPRNSISLEDWQALSFPPSHSIIFFMPRALGTPQTEYIGALEPGELLVTLSPAAWVLAILSLLFVPFVWRRHKEHRFIVMLWVGIIVSLILALGSFIPFNQFLHGVPPFSLFRIPARWLFLTTSFACVLGAFSLDRIRELKGLHRFLLLLGGYAVLGSMLIAFFAITWERPDGMPLGEFLFETLVSRKWAVWHYLIVMGYFAFLALPKRLLWLCASFAVFLGVTEYRLMEDGNLFPPAKHAIVLDRHSNPLLDGLAPADVQRLHSIYMDVDVHGVALPHNTAAYIGYRALGGYTPLYSSLMMRYLQVGQAGRTWRDGELLLNPAPLESAGVTHLFIGAKNPTPEQITAFTEMLGTHYERINEWGDYGLVRLPQAGARFEWAEEWARAESDEQIEQLLWSESSLDQSKPVLIHDAPSQMPEEMTIPETLEMELGGSFQNLKVHTSGPALLLIRDTYWKGWKYRVRVSDGWSDWQQTLRGNGFMRAVPVPGDVTKIEIKFTPPGFGPGLSLSVLSLLGILLISTGRLRRFATLGEGPKSQ